MSRRRLSEKRRGGRGGNDGMGEGDKLHIT
jgi:hypothetical protein